MDAEPLNTQIINCPVFEESYQDLCKATKNPKAPAYLRIDPLKEICTYVLENINSEHVLDYILRLKPDGKRALIHLVAISSVAIHGTKIEDIVSGTQRRITELYFKNKKNLQNPDNDNPEDGCMCSSFIAEVFDRLSPEKRHELATLRENNGKGHSIFDYIANQPHGEAAIIFGKLSTVTKVALLTDEKIQFKPKLSPFEKDFGISNLVDCLKVVNAPIFKELFENEVFLTKLNRAPAALTAIFADESLSKRIPITPQTLKLAVQALQSSLDTVKEISNTPSHEDKYEAINVLQDLSDRLGTNRTHLEKITQDPTIKPFKDILIGNIKILQRTREIYQSR